mgnify:CR=1 FL=1
MSTRAKGKKADYILYYKNTKPLAVVEAKRNVFDVGYGMQQAKEYAEILDIPFAYSSNGKSFLEYDFLTGKEREIDFTSTTCFYDYSFEEDEFFVSWAYHLILKYNPNRHCNSGTV